MAKNRQGAPEAPQMEVTEAAVESATEAAVEVEAAPAPIEAAPAVESATPAPEPPKPVEEEDGMRFNPQFCGGQVAIRRERVARLFDELLDLAQIRVLDQVIANLEQRKRNPAAKRDYKPGTWSASGT